jgi:hypothetical protein
MVEPQVMQDMVNMDGLIFLPFSSVHLDKLGMTDADDLVMQSLHDIQERLIALEESKMAWTIFYRGEPALCYGFEYKWQTNIEAWLIPGQVAIKHGTLLSRGARRLFDKIGPHIGLRRLQIVVDVEREKAVQWAEFLKFKREGVMKEYGPEGHDYYMYARIYT